MGLSMARRCFSNNTPAMAAATSTDPIQGLFLTKIQEYAAKKKAAGGALVDSSPATEAELAQELDKVAKQYGGGAGVDMTVFPSLQFKEPAIDSINIAS